MSVETEIKFLLSAPVARALNRDLFPAAVARADHLDTTYFDTPAGHLEAAKVALRLRLSDNRITQTIKTAPRASGPFSRGEVERVLRPALGPGRLETSALAAGVQPCNADRRGSDVPHGF